MVSFDGNPSSFSLSQANPRDLTVLIVGRLGQGVGLAGDVLAEAAALDGYWLWRREIVKEVGDVVGTGSVLRLASDKPQSPVPGLRIDLLLALDVRFGHRCRRLVKPTGNAIFVASPFAADWSGGAGGPVTPSEKYRRRPALAPPVILPAGASGDSSGRSRLSAPAEAIGLLLGQASRRLPLADSSWHAALEAQLPSVRVARCREMFVAGRLHARRWPDGQ